MIGKAATPREARREERIAEIITAAWKLAREQGIGGLSLHALARDVGIRQPSLYAYFDSKHALYDAMFADGNEQLLACLDATALPDDPRDAVKTFMRAFMGFALADTERHNLMFQRPIPGFVPSPSSYAYAERVMAQGISVLRGAGVTEQGDVDCFIAMVGGLIAAQISNDSGGDRWSRHLDHLTDMYLDDAQRRTRG